MIIPVGSRIQFIIGIFNFNPKETSISILSGTDTGIKISISKDGNTIDSSTEIPFHGFTPSTDIYAYIGETHTSTFFNRGNEYRGYIYIVYGAEGHIVQDNTWKEYLGKIDGKIFLILAETLNSFYWKQNSIVEPLTTNLAVDNTNTQITDSIRIYQNDANLRNFKPYPGQDFLDTRGNFTVFRNSLRSNLVDEEFGILDYHLVIKLQITDTAYDYDFPSSLSNEERTFTIYQKNYIGPYEYLNDFNFFQFGIYHRVEAMTGTVGPSNKHRSFIFFKSNRFTGINCISDVIESYNETMSMQYIRLSMKSSAWEPSTILTIDSSFHSTPCTVNMTDSKVYIDKYSADFMGRADYRSNTTINHPLPGIFQYDYISFRDSWGGEYLDDTQSSTCKEAGVIGAGVFEGYNATLGCSPPKVLLAISVLTLEFKIAILQMDQQHANSAIKDLLSLTPRLVWLALRIAILALIAPLLKQLNAPDATIDTTMTRQQDALSARITPTFGIQETQLAILQMILL